MDKKKYLIIIKKKMPKRKAYLKEMEMKDRMGRPEREERERNPGEFKGRCKGEMHQTRAARLEKYNNCKNVYY